MCVFVYVYVYIYTYVRIYVCKRKCLHLCSMYAHIQYRCIHEIVTT